MKRALPRPLPAALIVALLSQPAWSAAVATASNEEVDAASSEVVDGSRTRSVTAMESRLDVYPPCPGCTAGDVRFLPVRPAAPAATRGTGTATAIRAADRDLPGCASPWQVDLQQPVILAPFLSPLRPRAPRSPSSPPSSSPSSGPPRTPACAELLIITLDSPVFRPTTLNVFFALDGLAATHGYAVTHLINPAAGVIAAQIGVVDFDQVWLFEVVADTLLLSTGDADAIATWYRESPGNIIVDARSYGAYFDLVDETPFIENQVAAFCSRCGNGLWIGTDHGDMWTANANTLLRALGYGMVTDLTIGSLVAVDPTAELLNVPNVMAAPSMWHQTNGKVPTGVQFDGVELVPLLLNAEGSIVTSYALEANCD